MRVACDVALDEAKAAAKHCHEAETSLRMLLDEQATHAQRLQQREDDLKGREVNHVGCDSALSKVTVDQAGEHERLAKLKEEVAKAQTSHTKHVSEATARLDAWEKILADAEGKVATENDAFPSIKLRARQVLQSNCRGGFKVPLETLEGGYVGLFSKLT